MSIRKHGSTSVCAYSVACLFLVVQINYRDCNGSSQPLPLLIALFECLRDLLHLPAALLMAMAPASLCDVFANAHLVVATGNR